jgi:hypothetical protein
MSDLRHGLLPPSICCWTLLLKQTPEPTAHRVYRLKIAVVLFRVTMSRPFPSESTTKTSQHGHRATSATSPAQNLDRSPPPPRRSTPLHCDTDDHPHITRFERRQRSQTFRLCVTVRKHWPDLLRFREKRPQLLAPFREKPPSVGYPRYARNRSLLWGTSRPTSPNSGLNTNWHMSGRPETPVSKTPAN